MPAPPLATRSRYITRSTNPYRLPAMDLEHLLFEHQAFRYQQDPLDADH